jgi:hypothetical protein
MARIGMLGSVVAGVIAATTAACGGGGGSPGTGNPSLVALTTASIPDGTTGVEYSAQFEATVPHAPGLFYVTGGSLPTGVALDPLTGAVSGFPRQVGSFHVEVGVRDGTDTTLPPGRDATYAEDRRSYDVDVALGPPNILPQQPPAAQYRASYGYQIDVAGGTAPYTFAMTGGTLPAGISVQSSGFVGPFATEAQAAPYSFQVTVTDARGLTDTATLSLEVIVLPLILFTSNPIPEAALGFPYDLTLSLASGGGGVPYTWTQAPVGPGETDLATIGMQITSTGHLTDTGSGPTALGTFLFTIAVTDEPLQTATRQLSLTVNPGPVISTISPNRASLTGPFTVTGLNFQPGAAIVFKPGPTQTTLTPTFVSPTTLTFTGPVTKPVDGGGATPVLVRNPDGGTFTKPSAFVFPATTVSFGTKAFLPSTLSTTGLDVADVNGDGLADIVHAGSSGQTFHSGSPSSTNPGLILHMNLGGSPPTFGAATLDAGSYYDVKFADVNVDGKLDIVALGALTVRTWLNGVLGNPLGTFTVGPTSSQAGGYSWPRCLAVGKFNSDLIPDIVFGVGHYPNASISGRVFTMAGSGTGSFSVLDSQTSAPTNSYGVLNVCTIDSDGNGRSEVCAGVGMNPSSGPMFNWADVSSTGSFTGWSARGGTVTSPAYATANALIPGDFNGVGTPNQLVVLMSGSPNYAPGNARVMKLFTGGTLSTVTAITTVPSTVGKAGTAIDADFDTKTDWAVTSLPSSVLVYRGSTRDVGVSLDASVGTPAIAAPRTGLIASGDFDGDGKPDLVTSTSYWGGNGMAANYGSTYSESSLGNGGSMGLVLYLNTSN